MIVPVFTTSRIVTQVLSTCYAPPCPAHGQTKFLFPNRRPFAEWRNGRGVTRNAHPFGYLERRRPACGPGRPLGLRSRQEGRARSHHFQQVETDHARRPPALALD